jgi:hypothetical protein
MTLSTTSPKSHTTLLLNFSKAFDSMERSSTTLFKPWSSPPFFTCHRPNGHKYLVLHHRQ